MTSLPRTSSRLKTMQTWWCKWPLLGAQKFCTRVWYTEMGIGSNWNCFISCHVFSQPFVHKKTHWRMTQKAHFCLWHCVTHPVLWTFGLSTKAPTGGFLGFKAHLLGMLRGPWVYMLRGLTLGLGIGYYRIPQGRPGG